MEFGLLFEFGSGVAFGNMESAFIAVQVEVFEGCDVVFDHQKARPRPSVSRVSNGFSAS